MTPPAQPRHRIAIIQEKDRLEDTYKTRTVVGLLPYEESECDRLMRFVPEQYTRSRPASSTIVEDITFEGAAIVQAARKEAAAQAREDVLDALARDFKGRYVEDAVAEIRRFPESLRQGQQQKQGEP